MLASKYRKGQVSVQVYIEAPIHRKVKARLGAEGKTMRELVTKFLVWYGGGEEDDESHEDSETD
jgi:hypothetical protein